jgi:uncharacterized protein YkwD
MRARVTGRRHLTAALAIALAPLGLAGVALANPPGVTPRTTLIPALTITSSAPAATGTTPPTCISTGTKSTGAGCAPATAPTAATTTPSPAAQVLAQINKARTADKLAAYTETAALDQAASTHNQRMAGGCGLSHQCPGEPAIGARETAAGVTWTSCGENVGDGSPSSDTTASIASLAMSITSSMLNEQPPNDGHRANLLSTAFHHIGIAVYRDSGGTVWMTQDFSN